VRALARTTQSSILEIESLIASIQRGRGSTVNSLQQSARLSDETLEVAKAAGVALDKIAIAVSQINSRNPFIANATEEQSHMAQQVSDGLSSIRDTSIQTATGATQTASASHDLARIANSMAMMVKRFTIA
jgi:methyl-accepting chemotaxis protein